VVREARAIAQEGKALPPRARRSGVIGRWRRCNCHCAMGRFASTISLLVTMGRGLFSEEASRDGVRGGRRGRRALLLGRSGRDGGGGNLPGVAGPGGRFRRVDSFSRGPRLLWRAASPRRWPSISRVIPTCGRCCLSSNGGTGKGEGSAVRAGSTAAPWGTGTWLRSDGWPSRGSDAGAVPGPALFLTPKRKWFRGVADRPAGVGGKRNSQRRCRVGVAAV